MSCGLRCFTSSGIRPELGAEQPPSSSRNSQSAADRYRSRRMYFGGAMSGRELRPPSILSRSGVHVQKR